MDEDRPRVGVVLSGGGARGAYEAGVLSVLLPVLEARNERPTVFVGTSAGAINAAAFASLNHLPAQEAADKALRLWRDVRSSYVYRLRPARALLDLGALRRRRYQAAALLDSSPLATSLAERIRWSDLHANVDGGIATVGVIATACTTHRSSVFLDRAMSVELPEVDDDRSIDYVPTRLDHRHVLASTAIPMVFPPVELDGPGHRSDWYIDGGLRLNTPLKPAVALGVDRVVVIATDPAVPSPAPADGVPSRPPSIGDGAVQVLYAMLADNMVEDLRTMARRNREGFGLAITGHAPIGWLFAGPRAEDAGHLGQLVGEVLAEEVGTVGRLSGLRHLARRWAGRWLDRDPSRREVLSHLFFDAGFIDKAIDRGQRDARRSLADAGQELWKLGGSVTLRPRGHNGVHIGVP